MADLFSKPEADDFLVQDVQPARNPFSDRVAAAEARRKAAIAAGVTGDPAAYQQVLAEGESTGNSRTYDSIVGEVRDLEQQRVNTEITQVIDNPDIPFETKRDIATAGAQEVQSLSDTEILEKSLAASGQETRPSHRGRQQEIAEYIPIREEKAAYLRRLAAETLDFGDVGGIGRQFLDTFVSMALPGWGLQISEVINEAFPDLETEGTFLSPGTLLEDLADHFEGMTIEEFKQAAPRLLHAIDKNDFLGFENGFTKFEVFHTIMEAVQGKEEIPRFFYNVVGALDMVGAAEIARLGYLGFKHLGMVAADKARLGRRIHMNTDLEKTPGSVSSVMDEGSS